MEDQVPGPVCERLDLGKRGIQLETGLLAQDAPCGRVGMLAFGEVVVGEEPAALTVVARDVLIPHEEDAVVRDDGDVGDELDRHAESISDVSLQAQPLVRLLPGFGPPLHIHDDAAEAFYVLEGEYVMFLDDREVVCPAGSFIFIPAGMRHSFRVGTVPSRKLNFYFPAAMIGYFDELSEAIRRGAVEEGLLTDIARRHSMEVVGAVPESYV